MVNPTSGSMQEQQREAQPGSGQQLLAARVPQSVILIEPEIEVLPQETQHAWLHCVGLYIVYRCNIGHEILWSQYHVIRTYRPNF